MIGNQRIQTRGKCTDIIPAQVFSLGTTIDVGQMLGGTKNGLKTEGLFKFDTSSHGGGLDVDISSGSSVRPAAPDSPVLSFFTDLPAFPAFPVFSENINKRNPGYRLVASNMRKTGMIICRYREQGKDK